MGILHKELIASSYLGLSRANRYSNTKLMINESTSSHTIEMQLIALFLYEKFDFIDIKDLCWRILLHDLDELPTSCIDGHSESIGDIPRDVKYKSEDAKKLFSEFANDILNKSVKSEYVKEQIKNAKHDGSENGMIVDIIDSIQAVIKLRSEWILQGKDFVINSRYSESFVHFENKLNWYSSDIDKRLYNYFINLLNDFTKEYHDAHVQQTYL